MRIVHGRTTQAGLNEARLEALLQLSQMTEATVQEISDFALEQGVLLTGSEIGYVAFVNDDETAMTMHSWSRSAMARCRMADKPLVYPLETTGLWGEALRQRRPIITNDYNAPNPWKRGLPDGHVPIRRHMNVPVFDGSRVVVVAGVANKAGDYDDSDVRQLTLLFDGMWKLLQRQRAEAELRAHRFRLEEAVQQRTAELNHEIQQRKAALEALREEQQELKRLLDLHDRDRQLIGFEIHDGLTQLIVGALMQLESFGQACRAGAEADWERFEAGLELLRQGLREARRLIGGLRCQAFEEAGVVAGIEDLVDRLQTLEGTPEIEFTHAVSFDRLQSPLENAIFRIAQEALTNACRHSRSPRVRIALVQRDGTLRIEVEDWGVGFVPTAVADGHFGLESIRQRARLLAGSASIDSHPGAGTRITVDLPLDAC